MGQQRLYENGAVQYEYACLLSLVHLHIVFKMPQEYKILVGVQQVLKHNIMCFV